MDSVLVSLPFGMEAVISLPIYGENPEWLAVFNERGEMLASWVNPVTGTIDAYIIEGGIFSLR